MEEPYDECFSNQPELMMMLGGVCYCSKCRNDCQLPQNQSKHKITTTGTTSKFQESFYVMEMNIWKAQKMTHI